MEKSRTLFLDIFEDSTIGAEKPNRERIQTCNHKTQAYIPSEIVDLQIQSTLQIFYYH